MQDYNLTNEIKKISGAINNSSPNTELGNINGSVGNLDTAMQGVATAIGNISIPNTGSNIDGVATAINNKSIPDPSTALGNIVSAIQNIPDTSTALGNIVAAIQALGLTVDTSGLVALDGSNTSNFYASDCNSFLSGIFLCDENTGHMPSGEHLISNPKLLISIANPTTMVCNQIFITYGGTMHFRQYFLNTWGSWRELNASSIDYSDPNNIGAANVAQALNKLSAYSQGTGTLNSTYVSAGAINYQKFGKVVIATVKGVKFSSLPPYNGWTDKFGSGLPAAKTGMESLALLLIPLDQATHPIRVAMAGGGTDLYFHYTQTSTSTSEFNMQFMYICD